MSTATNNKPSITQSVMEGLYITLTNAVGDPLQWTTAEYEYILEAQRWLIRTLRYRQSIGLTGLSVAAGEEYD